MNAVRVFNTAAKAVEATAAAWAEAAHQAVKERGSFRVAMSGGGTAKALWFVLAKPQYRDLPWKETEFFWGDDRYVPIAHGESNFRAAKDLLLDPVGAVADRVHPMAACGTDPVKDAAIYEAAMRRHFGAELDAAGFPVFDLAFQGVGPDGHTASLFPGRPALAERERWVVASRAPGTAAVRDRITMTAPVLSRARNIVFLVTGEDKADAVARWLEGTVSPEECPAKLLEPVSGRRLVFLDQDAAGKLVYSK